MDQTYAKISCRVCGQSGGISKSKIRRLSGPAVIIGYLFLVPSVLGMMVGVVTMCATGSASSDVSDKTQAMYSDAIKRVEGLSPDQTEKVLSLDTPTPARLEDIGLSTSQVVAVQHAQSMRSAGNFGAGAGTAIGFGMGLFLLIGSFVGGLIGWILTMKKTVLLCSNCKGVHADAT